LPEGRASQLTQEKLAWVWLNMQRGVGPIRFQSILSHFGSVLEFLKDFHHHSSILKNHFLFSERSVQNWEIQAQKEAASAHGLDVDIITLNDEDYPSLLRQLRDAPPVLYRRGRMKNLDNAIALVGSRRATGYGRSVAQELSAGLARRGVVTVSGLARGIDTVVHEATISSGGETIAVLGSGLAQIYPNENRDLARQILDTGALFSEFPMQYPPLASHFPRRNRIIAGISLGTVVIEADLKSGALITARLAAEQGREVFAVPGPIGSSLTQGTHSLIQQGAKLIQYVDDIFEEIESLSQLQRVAKPHQGMTGSRREDQTQEHLGSLECQIFKRLGTEPFAIDALAAVLESKPQDLMSSLLALELKGLIQNLPGNRYVRSPRALVV